MKLIMENWRRFLAEADTVTAPPFTPMRQTAPAKLGAIKPMDPRDVKTPGTRRPPGTTKEVPQVEPSGEVQEHNVEALFRLCRGDRRVFSIFMQGYEGPKSIDDPTVAEQFINYLVVKNKIFHHNKIVDHLGAGSFGFVVKLDNDHALKIYIGSFDPIRLRTDPTGRSDIERYERTASKAFDEKTGEAGDLHIYEQGELETPFDKKWFYAEMQQLRTLSNFMREFAHPNKDAREVTDGVNDEITFLKELAHLAHLVDKHGAQAIAEFDPEEAYAKQHGRAFPEDYEDEIKFDPDFGLSFETSQGDTQLAEFAKLLEQGDLDAVLPQKIDLLDKTYAKNLFNQLKELLKTKTLRDITDVRGANIGVSEQDESLPIIFDY